METELQKIWEKTKKLGFDLNYFFRDIMLILKGCIKSVVLFSIIYSIVYIFIINSITDIAYALALKFSGLNYVGPDNLIALLMNPLSFAVGIIDCMLLTMVSLFEISGIMHAYSMSQIGKKTTLTGMVHAGIRTCIKTLKPVNWGCMVFIIVLMPLTGVLSLSGASLYVAVPGFVMDFIRANTLYSMLFNIGFAALLFIFFRDIYALHFYILEDLSFPKACRESQKLIKHNYIYSLLSFLGVSITFYMLFMGVAAAVAGIWKNPTGFLSGTSFSDMTFGNMANLIYINYSLLTGILSPVINIALLTVLFYTLMDRKNAIVKMSKTAFNDVKVKPAVFIVFVALIVSLLGFAVYENRSYVSSFLVGETIQPEVAAHRGESVKAPENTIPAFEMAIEEGADWIELDVHETKDGVIIVSHDDDLTRVSGKSVFVHDLTYDEVEQLDTGSWFSSAYKNLHLATLDEVLKVCKGKINVLIELKPSGYDHQLEEKVLQIINDNGMHEDVVIICLKAEPLQRMKELDPTIHTAYDMYVASGVIADIDFSDSFAIEKANVNPAIVAQIHNEGKKCFVWTVNSEDDVQYLVDCGVDVMMTDDPVMLQKAISSADYNPISRLARLYVDRVRNGL